MSSANRIDQALANLATQSKKGLLPYVTAGLPDLPTTERILETMDELGVTAVELGFPYSDPIADGPTIQASYTQALERGIRVREILDMVTSFRKKSQLPLLGMLSYSIVYRIGIENFVNLARQAGLDGLIIPDLSFEEAPQAAQVIADADMRLIMLVSPVTTPERRKKIAEISTGFIYYMSVTGITGERNSVPAELVENVHQLREISGKPVIVGFGISTADQVRLVCSEADGAIIGSALIRRIMETLDQEGNSDAIIQTVRSAVNEWMTGLP